MPPPKLPVLLISYQMNWGCPSLSPPVRLRRTSFCYSAITETGLPHGPSTPSSKRSQPGGWRRAEDKAITRELILLQSATKVSVKIWNLHPNLTLQEQKRGWWIVKLSKVGRVDVWLKRTFYPQTFWDILLIKSHTKNYVVGVVLLALSALCSWVKISTSNSETMALTWKRVECPLDGEKVLAQVEELKYLKVFFMN